MQFGRKYSDAPAPNTGGSGKWIKALKEGETRVRFLQEIDDWQVYYEHYNPAGTAFPCTGERDTCPGCTSDNPRMKSASRKNAVNCKVGDYVDVYKLPVKLTNRLVVRAERNGGTIRDRDYLITRVGNDKDTEYDLEAMAPTPFDFGSVELMDIESMLRESFTENFPDFFTNGTTTPARTGPVAVPNPPMSSPEPPPFEPARSSAADEETEISEAELRAMDRESLLILCKTEEIEVPTALADSGNVDEIVDFLMENNA